MDDLFTTYEFVSTGEWEGRKDLYSPPAAGVRMKLHKFEVEDARPGLMPYYYTVKITKDADPPTPSRPIIERAIYFPQGPDRLVALYNEVAPRLLMTDTIVLFRDSNKANGVTHIQHYLDFWNGDVASWPCRPL
jgi:hypothetical protein